MNLRFWMINTVGGIFGQDVFPLPGGGSVVATMSVKTL
jgi:hypothetical protein